MEAARPRPKPKQPLDRLSALSESDVAGAKPLLADVHPPHDEEGMQRTAGAAAGSNAAPLTAAAEDDAEEEEIANPVTYSYSFFHGIFALAAMYLAMLMTGAFVSPPRELKEHFLGTGLRLRSFRSTFFCVSLSRLLHAMFLRSLRRVAQVGAREQGRIRI